MIERIDIYLYTYLEINRFDFVNASIIFFVPETTKPLSGYSSSDGCVVMPNPAIADSEGRFPKIFINKPYRVEVHNQSGMRIFEDNYE